MFFLWGGESSCVEVHTVGVQCGWNSLWASWLVLLLVLVVLDGFIDLVLSFIKQYHDLLSS